MTTYHLDLRQGRTFKHGRPMQLNMHTPYMIHRTLPRASRRKHVGRPNPPWLIARDIRGGPAGASLLQKVHPKLHQLCFVIGSVIGSVIGRGAASGAVRRHGQRVLRATCVGDSRSRFSATSTRAFCAAGTFRPRGEVLVLWHHPLLPSLLTCMRLS